MNTDLQILLNTFLQLHIDFAMDYETDDDKNKPRIWIELKGMDKATIHFYFTKAGQFIEVL